MPNITGSLHSLHKIQIKSISKRHIHTCRIENPTYNINIMSIHEVYVWDHSMLTQFDGVTLYISASQSPYKYGAAL